MRTIAALIAGLQLAAAVAIPIDTDTNAADAADAADSTRAELSGLWETLYSDNKPGKTVQEQDVPAGVFLETNINKQQPATPGAKVTSIKYGPYRVPAMSGLENRPSLMLEKPCTSCYIVAMQSNLLTPDGKEVNIDQGAWLHHMVMYNNGLTRRDAVCAMDPQRIFASGNERTPVRTNGKYKYGIEFGIGDSLGMLYDLMNESKQAATYYIEMTYEWVPSTTSGYKAIKMAWLDVTGCGASDTPARVGNYELKSPGWRSTYSGRLLSATGHTHDGGQEVTIYKNGQAVCKSLQIYGRKPAFIGGMDMPGMPGMKMTHISDTGSCVDFGDIKPGDSLVVGARYNTSAHPLNKNMNGRGNAPIMGISQVYIG